MSLAQLKQMIADEAKKHQPQQAPPPPPQQPAIEYRKDPEALPVSPGQGLDFPSTNFNVDQYMYYSGDWKGNMQHIYAHLLEQCANDGLFRQCIGAPKIGKVSQNCFILLAQFETIFIVGCAR